MHHRHLKRLSAHTLCIATALALTGCDGLNFIEGIFGMNEKAMNCSTRTPERIQEVLRNIRTEPVYQVNKSKAVGVVHFELDIPGVDPAAESEMLLFVKSGSVGAMVFAGPFQPSFSIEFDERVHAYGSQDNIEFRLFRPKQNQICVQAQQVEYPFWQPGATVKVRFLRERYIDKANGVPIGFEVDITKP